MVDDATLKDRMLKTDILIRYGILTVKDKALFESSLSKLTNVEVLAFQGIIGTLTHFASEIEVDRRKHLFELWYVHSKQMMGLEKLTAEQIVQLTSDICEECAGFQGFEEFTKMLRGLGKGGE